MPRGDSARIIVRMPDYSALLAFMDQRREAKGIRSPRALSLLATGKPDAIRQLERGQVPGRERLRRFDLVLGCQLAELEALAPDVRVDSRADAARLVIDALDSIPEDRIDDFVESVEATARAIRR